MTPHNMLPDDEPRIEYFRDHDHQALETFYGVWEAAGRPLVRVGWRDPEGGWVRWLWFPHEGQNHALFLPAYMGAGRSEAQTLLIKALYAGMRT